MQMTSQNETICFLGSCDTFGGGAEWMELISTHISVVLLIGSRALKLKRAVKLAYVDLSTPERRLAMCEQELMLNRRTAPGLYRAVHRITRERNGELALNGLGELVDAVLEMERLIDTFLFDRMAQRDRLITSDISELAGAIARFHRAAPVSSDGEGAKRMERVLAVNERAFADADILSRSQIEPVVTGCREALARHAGLLDQRAREGKVRRGHGDLHLRNICLSEGKPLLFDCLEFDEDLATVDVLYDLAFVLMDLWHRKLEALANVLFNRYLDAFDDELGIRLLPFFMAVRAAVRAHVVAVNSGRPESDRLSEARGYLDLCRRLLRAGTPLLAAVGGYSGSGKSTLAARLAPMLGPPPGARIAATDRIRKKLYGVPVETRLPTDAYSADVSVRSYSAMMQTADMALMQGHAAIADAVFDHRIDRERIGEVARRAGVPFCGLWLQASREMLLERVSARRGDPSDATPSVVIDQISRHGAATEWTRIAAQENIGIVATAAFAAIGLHAGAAAVWPVQSMRDQ
ncbi:AAA family ATPase [Bosea sp. TAF32]|uniref:bifunctional aminoglycoside phosphotransferase/ATP-binding protein n=1 Tax=Bosea sp. TAF32 TaxID=3237482 RepID=UPI003F91ECA1